MGWNLMEIAMDLDLAAACLCHLATIAMHLLAAVPLHARQLRSRCASKCWHHHDEHDNYRGETSDAPHKISIFPYLATPTDFTFPCFGCFLEDDREQHEGRNRIRPRNVKERVQQ